MTPDRRSSERLRIEGELFELLYKNQGNQRCSIILEINYQENMDFIVDYLAKRGMVLTSVSSLANAFRLNIKKLKGQYAA